MASKVLLLVKRLNKEAIVPVRQHETDVGLDLVIEDDAEIHPQARINVSVGLAVQLPPGTWGKIEGRSSLAIRDGIIALAGVIDQGYRGELFVVLYNPTGQTKFLKAGARIAQLIVMPYVKVDPVEVPKLDESDRGEAGMGSTG